MCVITFDWEENDANVKVENFMKNGTLSWYVIELTHRCNFSCVWCYAGSGKGNPEFDDMPLEKLEAILDFISKNGVRQVTFSGGEPTIYPKLTDAVRAAHERGLIVHLNSNGFLLDEAFLRRLKEAGLSQVQINIDSLQPERHDKVRGMPNSHERAMDALRIASGMGITAVSQTVITKDNEREVVEILKKARRLGVQRCRIWDMVLSGTALENKEILPTDFISSVKEVVKFAKETGARHIESGDPMFPLGEDYEIPISGGLCAAINGGFATIAPNGVVFPCATIREGLYNIFDAMNDGRPLAELHKDAIKAYREKIGMPSGCAECEHADRCFGGCPTRRINGDVDYWCSLTENRQS